MLVHERLNNIGEPAFKSSYIFRKMDPSLLNRISEILLQVESASYVRRVALVVFLVFAAFLLNSIVGRLLEKMRQIVIRRMLAMPADDQGEVVVFGLDLAFGLVNLTCTALLAWEVHYVCTWILQTDHNPSQVDL